MSSASPDTTVPASPPVEPIETPRGGLRRRLLSGGLWVVGARLFGMGSTVLANVVLARQLALEAFGDFVVICSIANAASLFAMFGLNSAVVRFVGEELASENRRGARHVLWLCYRLALGTTLVTAAVVCGGICLAGDRFLELTDFARIALMT
ncbi:MAG TPA: oligosaccharide flippase family protein, partial [Planctomycetaceae bacterium]|nr:oligosaccharide flippase family protein [Planctomycetaceae bacterium]